MLDLHTYANSFYFADISDIVTYIDENLGDKEIYADCVDVEEFLYFYYPISPYERVPLSAREEDDEIPKHYILNASTPLSPSAAYIVRKENQEFIIALSGSFDVLLDDGKERRKIHLNRSYYGLYVPKQIWRQMDNFSTNSLALILSSTPYGENDYIRDYETFKNTAL